MRPVVLSVLLSMAVLACGCSGSGNARFETTDRLSNGLIIILPGIEGESALNHQIRDGMVAGGVYRALPIYSWGRPVPIAGLLLNQMDFIGNRLEGRRIARMIAAYQDNYPGRPVYLIGHSGGGGVAVFAAEAMEEDRKIDGLVLLSASISSAYDLTKAMNHCRNGILNIYSKADVGFLIVGTTVAGNVDGIRGPAAGAISFDKPRANDKAEKQQAYQKLYEMELTGEAAGGLGGAHASTTRSGFVATYVVPWVTSPTWPPPALAYLSGTGAATP
jgi:pimeloyl-ACP methyl ester carboxylesterase